MTKATDSINEDNNLGARFILAADSPTNVDTSIQVRVRDIANSPVDHIIEQTHFVRLPFSHQQVSLYVRINDVAGDGPNGVLVAELLTGSGYTVANNNAIQYVIVRDTDPPSSPVVSVSTSHTLNC